MKIDLLPPSTLLQDRYLIVRNLAMGGMGAIYQALDQRLGGNVALKQSLFSYDHLLRKQFENEARLLAHLRHKALPKVIDHFIEGDGQFLVMEFIPGDDLEALLDRNGSAFPLVQVLDWANQLLEALHYLHIHKPPIIHRDIKPSNLKLTPQGEIVLLDFGLAKGTTGDTSTTLISLAAHTPAYAPIEQILNKHTDPRSDLFSLAVTVYHLMTGVKPPNALERFAIISSGLPDPLQQVDEIDQKIPVSIATVLKQAMTLNSDQRPNSALVMSKALQEATLPLVIQNNPRSPSNKVEESEAGEKRELKEALDERRRLFLEEFPHLPAWAKEIARQYLAGSP